MNKELLIELFDNTEISEEIRRFCFGFPEYVASKEAADHWLARVKRMLGYEEYCEFEQAMMQYYGNQAYAYYLFGLNLRRDLQKALFY